MNPARKWTREIDGTTYTAYADEIRPGVYEISRELLDILMRDYGWVEQRPDTEAAT